MSVWSRLSLSPAVLVSAAVLAISLGAPPALAGKAPNPPEVGSWIGHREEDAKQIASFRITEGQLMKAVKVNVPAEGQNQDGEEQCPGGVLKVSPSENLEVLPGRVLANSGRVYSGYFVGVVRSQSVEGLPVSVTFNGHQFTAELEAYLVTGAGQKRELSIYGYGRGCGVTAIVEPTK